MVNFYQLPPEKEETVFVSKLAVLHVCHVCPEMQAVTKMADFTKFCQTE